VGLFDGTGRRDPRCVRRPLDRRPRRSYEHRAGFYAYWDEVGFAVATTHERARIEADLARLRQQAFHDEMTGLPNGRALDDELRAHEQTTPFSVLVLDFDGMREANNTFKSYELECGQTMRNVAVFVAPRSPPSAGVAPSR
jgi:hypothetical protein